MRRRANNDGNHKEIVDALEAAGCAVESLAAVGNGVPDILCSRHGVNYLLEVKNPARKPSGQKLRPSQVDWHAAWRGQSAVVKTAAEALAVVGAVITVAGVKQ